jgi:DNA-binding MarR family transcriptional regulator
LEERFELLTQMVWGVHGNVQRLKADIAAALGIKSAHVFLIYLLRKYPQGLTAAELGELNRSTDGLISRETAALLQQGIITTDKESERRRYGCKYLLTEKGREIATRIADFAMHVQHQADVDLTEEDLRVFYRTFAILLRNFDGITGKQHLNEYKERKGDDKWE